MSEKQSPRSEVYNEFLAWLQNSKRWNAPYGILTGMGPKNMYRTVTFGIARYLDATCRIYSPKKITLRTSRSHGEWSTFTSLAELQKHLTTEV